MNVLEWVEREDGLWFRCLAENRATHPDDWPRLTNLRTNGSAASVAPLVRVINEESVTVEDAGVLVPHGRVARFTPSELSALGLPPVAPQPFELDSQGLVTDADYRVVCRFLHPSGRTLMGTRRRGSLLHVGSRSFVLSEPYFTILEAAERLSSTLEAPERMRAVADLQTVLPADAKVGDHFRSVQVVRADRFSILPFADTQGEASFDVVPMSAAAEPDLEPQPALPAARQRDWAKNFRQLPAARNEYPAGQGWYLVTTGQLRDALVIAKRVQGAPPHVRAEFVRNPRAFLAASDLDGGGDLAELFVETAEYSERVKGIGLWVPKVVPYLKAANEPWLPPEEGGLVIDGVAVRIEAEDAPALIARVQEAVDGGRASVDYNGVSLPACDATIQALQELQSRQTPPKGEAAPAPRTALLIKDNLDQLSFETRERDRRPISAADINGLRVQLLPHQREGVEWLQQSWTTGKPGVLLADDMGLGKTLQTLAFLRWIQMGDDPDRRPEPFLLVAPTGLLKNWVAEHEKHFEAPGLGVLREAFGSGLRGMRRSSAKELASGLPSLDLSVFLSTDLVLTTYETVRDYQHSFGQIRWRVVVFDEAQKIKNPSALMTDAAKALNADFVLALTGTPVENRLADLWCIVDTVRPGNLGALREFVEVYERPAQTSPEPLRLLKRRLMEDVPPIVLRRMKSDHLRGLPAISWKMYEHAMPSKQADAYNEAVRAARADAGRAGAALEALQRLRQVSLHPGVDENAADSDLIGDSARLCSAFRILDQVHGRREKALIFIDDLRLQAVLAGVIQRRFGLNAPPLIINGSVSGPHRKRRADEFQQRDGFDVLILSPRAGGVGLTLTAANHVVHLARWWNPAVEDQATDRVYRIGQTRTVTVHVPMALHPTWGPASFDARLDQLMSRKRELSRAMLAPAALSEADVQELYRETVGEARAS